MIIHVMQDKRHNEWPFWDGLDENDKCVGTEVRLSIFRPHSMDGTLHRGVHNNVNKRSNTIQNYEGIWGVSIYWYERK